MTVPPTAGEDPAVEPSAGRAAGEPVESAGTASEKPDGPPVLDESAPNGRRVGDEPAIIPLVEFAPGHRVARAA